MIRPLVRNILELSLGGGAARRRIGRRPPTDTLVLAFHNVVPDDAPPTGDRSLHLPLSRFTEIIERLRGLLDPVAIDRIDASPAGSRARFAVTFDDAYRGAVTLALPVLRTLEIPATVYVPTGMMDDRDFWWDVVADPTRDLAPAARHHALEVLHGDDASVRAWMKAQGGTLHTLPAEWRSCSLAELRTAVGQGNVALGSHTVTHRALDTLTAEQVTQELSLPQQWFRDHGFDCIPSIAYPYGRSSAIVTGIAAEQGYASGWLVEGGWSAADGRAPQARPRLNIPAGMSPRGVLLRAAELLS